MKILITGANGLVGRALTDSLAKSRITCHILSTKKNQVGSDKRNVFYWNPAENKIDERAFEGVDTIVHLAGEPIFAKAWTAEQKKKIIDSRVQGANLLLETSKKQNLKLNHFISASGIGYYGNGGDEWLNEASPSDHSFTSEVCQLWENAASHFSEIGARVSVMRIGIVLSKDGGYLAEMHQKANWGLLTSLGNGKQYVSWIHIDDLIRILVDLIQSKLEPGTYNASSPNPITNRELTRALAKAWHKSILLPPAPVFALKLLLGERSQALLDGQKASSEKLNNAGFPFNFETVADALKNLYP
jgi:uncharacterized protein (TIGR01777 family)